MKITLGLVALAVGLVLSGCSDNSAPEPPLICNVTDKAQTVEVSGSDGDTSSKQVYFVYADCGVFQVYSLFDGWGAELYNRIQVGHTYEFKTWGARVAVFGAYPQITDAIEQNK